MSKWLKLVVILSIITLSKAHHIKLIVLAVLGLAGLFMVHTLAQDYQKINGGAGKFFSGISKRSIRDGHNSKVLTYPEVDWDKVISNDPSSCARSFTCQLAAIQNIELQENERIILETIRHSSKGDSFANSQIRKALDYGTTSQQNTNDNYKCQKLYKQCPYSLKTMIKLLMLLGDMEEIQSQFSRPVLDT